MRILFVSPRQCWPPHSGAKLREYHFLRALAESNEVVYAHFTEPGAAPLAGGDLPFCREVIAVPKPRGYSPGQLLRGVLGRWPVSILNYTSRPMREALRRLAGPFDLLHLDSIHMVRYREDLAPAVRTVCDWHNIESELMRRYAAAASFARRRYAAVTARKLARLEQELLGSAFGHIVCSERERDELRARAPEARIEAVENGVDTAYFAGLREPGARRRLVFVGSMDYAPNIAGAVWFARELWPAVRAAAPGLTLSLVGAKPAPAVQSLAALPGVEVTGTVPDVRPYYRDALAAVVPLRTGSGTRLKILEAMAAGVPVVSTPLGAEGLAVTPGRDIVLVPEPDPAAWAGRIARLASEPAEAAALAAEGARLVRDRYDWTLLGRRLADLYREWTGGGN
jgi:sugar transferase (PEP-CTERM/EpsH1 system associated)